MSSTSTSDLKEQICAFLANRSCYDVLPNSQKLVVFDTSLLVKKALAALLQHGYQSAPLWDSSENKLAGMLTVTDFIHLILFFYNNPQTSENIDQMTIDRVKQIEKRQNSLKYKESVTIHPNASLFQAAQVLLTKKLHRLPLISNNQNIISVVTQYRILKYLALNNSQVLMINAIPKDSNVGTFGDIAHALISTPLVNVLNIFVQRRVSSVPILNAESKVIDVCEKYDILNLARETSFYDLEMPISECLRFRAPEFEGIHTCHVSDSIGDLFKTIKQNVVHRFVVVDKNNKLQGMISLSDLLSFLIN